MTILNNGNVGIGTVAPSAKLHVTGNSKIETGVLDLDPGYSIRLGGAASGIYSGSATSYMVFTVGSSERFRVNGSSGNVGIGTTAPAAKLQVSGGALLLDNSQYITIKDSTGVADEIIGVWSDDYTKILSAKNGIDLQNDAGSTLVRIQDGGNVGIGTTVPARSLHVKKDQAATTELLVDNTGTISAATIAAVSVGEAGIGYGTLRRYRDGSGLVQAGNLGAAPFDLITNATSRLRIDSTGNVGIGTTSPTQLLHVNGTAYATTFLHTSDRRLKTDINSIPAAAQLTTKLRGVHFRWKKDGVPAYGVIAQEVEAVIPDAVTTNADGTKAVDYDQLVPVLIEAVKALQVEVDALKRERTQR